MEQQESIQVVEIGNKIYTLILNELPDNINIKDFLNIDVGNIIGEILTFPVLLNQISNLKTEAEFLVNNKKMQLEILKANTEKDFKTSKSIAGLKCTVADVENHITLNENIQNKSNELLTSQKNLAYIEGLYWSAQSKGNALFKISDKLNPDEFSKDILIKTVNNVLIKKFDQNSI